MKPEGRMLICVCVFSRKRLFWERQQRNRFTGRYKICNIPCMCQQLGLTYKLPMNKQYLKTSQFFKIPDKTIEITALDLRLCSDFKGASNTQPCGQRMIITEPQNQLHVIDVTSNDDQGYLGLKRVYLSKTNQVTIQVQSDGRESSFNVWLYVEPSGGKW